MIIDISSYNGKIDFTAMAASENIERVIMRGTTKNGELDTRLIENINGACANLSNDVPIDVYKFSYARNNADATVEAYNLIASLKLHGLFSIIDTIWLDLEDFDGRSHTTKEAAEIIAAYASVCALFGAKFGIYCNYNYLKHILPKWAKIYKIWLARWGTATIGDTFDFDVILWQYTSKGTCAGIKGDVDLSKRVNA